MDHKQFDGIARHLISVGSRRQAITALVAGGLGLSAMTALDAEARNKKKRKKKKRCKLLGAVCKPESKRKCCEGLSCEVRPGASFADCCLPLGAPCETADDCCQGACLAPLLGGGSKRCFVIQP
jgi:hypothetical protein